MSGTILELWALNITIYQLQYFVPLYRAVRSARCGEIAGKAAQCSNHAMWATLPTSREITTYQCDLRVYPPPRHPHPFFSFLGMEPSTCFPRYPTPLSDIIAKFLTLGVVKIPPIKPNKEPMAQIQHSKKI